MAEQLTFDLPSETARGQRDFFVSESNDVAVEAVQSWTDWPQGKMILMGPEGSGKTHLAHIWAAMTGAVIVSAGDVLGLVSELAKAPVVVEDVDEIAGDEAAEEALFHLHNLCLSEGQALLMTSAEAPARLDLSLPDLKSRMQGSALVQLSGPDEALLTALLAKQFSDRQLTPEPEVLRYLVLRMERSFTAAGRLVQALDKAALSEKRPITKPLAALVLDKLGQGGA